MPTSTDASSNYGRQRRACVKLPTSPHYQRQAFEEGLRRLRFEIDDRPSGTPHQGDLLILWNRYPRDERVAAGYEAAGADVLITENAFLAPDTKPQTWFAIARNHHLGAGTWHVGDKARPIEWPVKPWRKDGNHILIIPQRGLGEPGVRMPQGWAQHAEHVLHKATNRPIRVRNHPGVRPHPTMDADLEDCWAAVTWASGGALKAICAGVPIFYEFENWIGSAAARFGIYGLENPFLGDRDPMLHKLSWAQWNVDEIAKGIPFQWLLKF